MHVRHLALTNFRNYTRLELDLPSGVTLLQGDNAQGKTSLLEAIHYLATGRAPQAEVERELINWLASDDPLPFAKVAAEITHDHEMQRIEITLLAANGSGQTPGFRKQVRINGVPRRAIDLVGTLRVVLFVPQDIDLVAGAPARRRRYLDVALCQMNPLYCHALASYNQALAQRNALLRALRERGGDLQQLHFWDDQLAEHGARIIAERQRLIVALDLEARARHRALTDGRELLRLQYLPSFVASPSPVAAPAGSALSSADLTPLSRSFAHHLRAASRRDLAAGMTLAGPHRDDLRFLVGERDLRTYGSRGQQRTAALALKLAEVEVMTRETGEPPILLLDDVMSELDATRRQMLLGALDRATQAIITTTDWEDFTKEFRAQAHRLRVVGGKIEEA